MDITTHPRRWGNQCKVRNREKRLPVTPGIYAVLDGDQICYIGKSKNLNARWRGDKHHRYEQARREIHRPILAWFTCSAGQIDSTETQLIRYWKSKGQAPWNYSKVPVYGWNWRGFIENPLAWAAIAGAISLFIPNQSPPIPPQGHANIYVAPTLRASVTMTLPKEATVEVHSCDGGWVEIKQGWVPITEFDKSKEEVCK